MRLIDADVLLDDILEVMGKKSGVYTVCGIIRSQPTISQERTAKQEDVGDVNAIFGIVKCSNCNGFEASRHKYCPNCGAKFIY